MIGKLMLAGAALALGLGLGVAGNADAAAMKKSPAMGKMSVTSAEIRPGATIADEQVANLFGCKGGNVSPGLKWSGAPAAAKSFAVTIYDPDAPTGSGFWHWVVFNIPANVAELPKGAGDPKAGTMPSGAIQSRTDFGIQSYGGPCPPPGDKPHHYIITVFAVDIDHIDADANAAAAVIGFNLHYHTLAKATLIGKYGRSK
jgi:Raf kinase inhibitor-like YbhB/YbcL family protein